MSWLKRIRDRRKPAPPRDAFEIAVAEILVHEGGYVNDPRDPGGETKYGISKRQYPSVEIKTLSKEGAKRIYRNDYWLPCRCDEMPADLALAVFDTAVNQGVGVATKLLQRCLGVKADGVIGAKTMGALAKAENERLLVLFLTERVLRYTRTKNFDRYGRGWVRRVLHIMRTASSGQL